MRAITQYLKREGYELVEDGFYTQVDTWFRWYKGKLASFHEYRQYNGMRKLTRTRKTMGMAKKIAEDWANLALNEKVAITIAEEQLHKRVHEVLDANNFYARSNQLLELTFALGTGAFVEYQEGGAVKIDYIRAGMIYPLSWDNGEVTMCAFASERMIGNKRFVYLNTHKLETSGYVIENKMLRREGGSLFEVALPEGVQAVVRTGSKTPLFQLMRPNIVNNIDPDCPLGISVYANALDQLEGIDLVYDSYVNEFRLGKKRIIVPMSMARIHQTEDGITPPVFDDNDTEFYAVDPGKDGVQKIEEINMELRYEAHEAAIKTALNLLSSKCGLGNDRYHFERSAAKTATEVVSEKSDLFQNLRKHELVLKKTLADVCRGIASLLGVSDAFTISIDFDDSIIEDRPAELLRDQQQVRDHLMAVWEYRVKYFGESEEAAKTMARELEGGGGSMGFGGDG